MDKRLEYFIKEFIEMANKPFPVAKVFRKWELTDSSIAHSPYVES